MRLKISERCSALAEKKEEARMKIAPWIADKADRIPVNPMALQLFVMQFSEIYGIDITTDEAIIMLGQIALGWIPSNTIYIKGAVLLERMF
jgi:hypothetical protein